MQGSGARANSSSAHLFVFTSAKAGMASVNQDAVNKVVYEMSKDSDYFKNEQRKAEEVSKKIEELRENMKKVPKSVYQSLETKYYADANRLRANQRFDRCWIHIDMDMFYAAVAIRDRPELVGKPVAVGGLSMISTANYEARSFGVRSAMPGFIAKQLCPELIFVPAEFEKYEDIASQIRKIFVVYDENFDAISLDEASLDITEYIKRNFSSELGSLDIFRIGEDIAQHIRKEIFEQTRLTSSAGISCNRMLAKICSDVNKPNGQKLLMGDHDEIQKFMEDLPVRKLPGVGKVTERVI